MILIPQRFFGIIAIGIGVLILVGVVAWSGVFNTLEEPSRTVTGNVTGINEERLQIYIEPGPGEDVLTLTIDEDTQILRSLYRTQETGEVIYYQEELNMSDVSVGGYVVAQYTNEGEEGLTGVTEIFTGEAEWTPADELRAEQSTSQGVIVSFDATERVLRYELRPPTVPSPVTIPVFIGDDVALYRTASIERAQIAHARQPATVSDLTEGSEVVIINGTTPLGNSMPVAVVVLDTNLND